MTIYNQLKDLQAESKKFIYAETDHPSFFYFVEYCGKIKTITGKIFQDSEEIDAVEMPTEGNNLITVQAVRSVSQKIMKEQKIIAKSVELPTSRAWTAAGINETITRIKNQEQTSLSKIENLDRIESLISTKITIGTYKSVRQMFADSLREKQVNPKFSCKALIPVKYRLFVSQEEIQTLDRLISIVGDMNDDGISEIENMNYIEFKYSALMFVTALRLIYEFPPNYEIYRFCSTLPKNPSENSELVQKLDDLIFFADSKMLNMMRLAKLYDKYEQYEMKVLESK
jgi:hypothetical protein